MPETQSVDVTAAAEAATHASDEIASDLVMHVEVEVAAGHVEFASKSPESSLGGGTDSGMPPSRCGHMRSDATLKELLQVFSECKYRSVCVRDGHCPAVFVDMTDVIKLLLTKLSDITDGNEINLQVALEDLASTTCREIANFSVRNAWKPLSSDSSISEIVHVMMSNDVRRVPMNAQLSRHMEHRSLGMREASEMHVAGLAQAGPDARSVKTQDVAAGIATKDYGVHGAVHGVHGVVADASISKSTECNRCHAGTFASFGSIECSLCPTGRASGTESEKCTVCPAGKFCHREQLAVRAM